MLRNAAAALAWLQHCQRHDIDDHIGDCEREIGRHYLELAKDRAEELAELSSSSLIRITQTYAHYPDHPNVCPLQLHLTQPYVYAL